MRFATSVAQQPAPAPEKADKGKRDQTTHACRNHATAIMHRDLSADYTDCGVQATCAPGSNTNTHTHTETGPVACEQ